MSQSIAPLEIAQDFRRRLLAPGIAATSATNVIIGLCGFLTGPLLARTLGPGGRGELAALQNVFWLAGTVGMLGMAEATLFFCARSKRDSRKVVFTAISVSLCCTPLLSVIAWLFANQLFAAQNTSTMSYGRLYVFAAPLFCLSVIPAFALRGGEHFHLWNLVRLAPAVVWLGTISIVGLHAHSSSTFATAYLLVLIVSGIIGSGVLLLTTEPAMASPPTRLVIPMLRYGLPLGLASVPTALNLRLDQISMAALLSPDQLGYYSVAVAWSGICTPILIAIGTVLFPKIARLRDSAELAKAVAEGTQLALVSATLIALVVAFSTSSLLPKIFGEVFRPAVAAAVVSVFAAAISGYNVVLEECLRGLGNTKAVLRAELIGFVVILSTVFIAVARMGIIGAAFSSLIGYLFTTVALLWSVSVTLDIPSSYLFPFSRKR